MDLLIIYSEKKKGELVSLGTLLYEKKISFHPVALPAEWTIDDSEDLLFSLKNSTHSIFLMAPEDKTNACFVFAAGYCLGSHEKSYLFDPGGKTYPDFWKELFPIFTSFAEFIEKLWEEKRRWEVHLSRKTAQKQLEERGLEVTETAFLEAVKMGDSFSAELFLRAGFSANLVDKSGVPVLSLAVRGQHLGLLKLLLEQKADVNAISRDRGNTALMDAAAEGNVEMIQILVDAGSILDCQSRNGQTALVLAIGKSADAAARVLLQAGSNPHLEDKLGMSAFKYAQLFGRQELLSLMKPENAIS